MVFSFESFTVGPWRVRPRLLRIDGDGKRQTLRPKVMGLLRALAEHPGRVVRKDEILERVWEGAVVSDEVLRRTVFELRQAFGDDPRSPRFVETIPRVGYRLIAPVIRGDAESREAAAGRRHAGRPLQDSVPDQRIDGVSRPPEGRGYTEAPSE